MVDRIVFLLVVVNNDGLVEVVVLDEVIFVSQGQDF